MKVKKLLITIFIAIIFFNIQLVMTFDDDNISRFGVLNIEALAQDEGYIPPGGYVPNIDCHTSISSSGNGNFTHVTFCSTCNPELARSWSGTSKCNSKNK